MSLQAKRVLITGGSGMIGSSLARRIERENIETYILSRPGAKRLRLKSLEKTSVVEGDMLDSEGLTDVIKKTQPDLVFHMASTPFNPSTIALTTHVDVNIIGAVNLIQALNQCPEARLVYTGSAAVYGSYTEVPEDEAMKPNTMLGATKAAASALFNAHSRITGRKFVELRLFTPYGPSERANRLIPAIVLSALSGKDVDTSEGYQTRDFLYIDDVLTALLLAAERTGGSPELFNIGSGKSIAVRDLVKIVLDIMGNPVRANYGAYPMRSDEILEMTASIELAKQELGWEPEVGILEGIEKTISWISDNRELASQLD
ncbi:MAG: NAD(P)-dependent oxidoreductase [Pseudomonadota bacterium]|nr:NAD(P)-dependent oxidoreductase [Pseudomonadota bacterium]